MTLHINQPKKACSATFTMKLLHIRLKFNTPVFLKREILILFYYLFSKYFYFMCNLEVEISK